MDCSNGRIHLVDQDVKEALSQEGRPLAPLNDRQHRELTPMNAHQRKGYMRNQPCVCGSGKKFKRCCWGKYS